MQFNGGGLMRASPLWPLRGRPSPAKQRVKGGKTRVLILMSDTGGGHRASAEAIKAGAGWVDARAVGGGDLGRLGERA